MGEIYIPWVFCLTLMITLEPMILWWSLLYERKIIILRNIPVMEVWMGWAKLLSGKTFQLYGTISSHSVLEFHRPFLPFLSMLIYMYYNRVLPRIKWRPSGWAWFGRSFFYHINHFGYHIKEIELWKALGGLLCWKGLGRTLYYNNDIHVHMRVHVIAGVSAGHPPWRSWGGEDHWGSDGTSGCRWSCRKEPSRGKTHVYTVVCM